MYALIDSGHQKKLERFGSYLIQRPCFQAYWNPQESQEVWKRADAQFSRDQKERWYLNKQLPSSWDINLEGVQLKVALTDFGHLGVFPEHAMHWEWMWHQIQKTRAKKVLNLFAYSGAATLYLAQKKVAVCHVDASKGMVGWAKENAALNSLSNHPIRWIVDDAMKFLKREVKRKSYYDGIILDPPSFGRGSQGQVFKIEEHLRQLLQLCIESLSSRPSFLLLTSHTPGFTPLVLRHVFEDLFQGRGQVCAGEMAIPSDRSFSLPSGTYARWSYDTNI